MARVHRLNRLIARVSEPGYPLALIACFVIVILSAPIAEQAHADHGDMGVCCICKAHFVSETPIPASFAPLAKQVVVVSVAWHFGSPTSGTIADVRSRGPPQA